MTRPLIIELAGPPASGKTTTATLLWELLTAAGFAASVVREAAERAPFRPEMKRDWRFTGWTLFQTVSEVLRHGTNNSDFRFVIFDRGLVDELCWIHWFSEREQIPADTRDLLFNIAEHEGWFPRNQVLCVLTAKFSTAVKRRGIGRIINATTYDELTAIYETKPAIAAERHAFPLVFVRTDAISPHEVANIVFHKLLATNLAQHAP